MTLHVWPFARQDAVHHRVTRAAVAAGAVMADYTISFRPERFDGPL